MGIAPTREETAAATNSSNLAAIFEAIFGAHPPSLHDGSTDEIRNQVAGLAAGLSQNIHPKDALPKLDRYSTVAPTHIDMNANIQHAYDFLAHHCHGHWTEAQAIGIVANIIKESGCNPHGTNGDGGKAMGLCQWHADRRTEFERHFHKRFQDSTFDDQLAFIDYELTAGNEQAAVRILKQTKDPRDCAAVVTTYYERPADKVRDSAIRASTAAGLVNQLQHSGNGSVVATLPAEQHPSGQNEQTKTAEADPKLPAKPVNKAYALITPHAPKNAPTATSAANTSDTTHLPNHKKLAVDVASQSKPDIEKFAAAKPSAGPTAAA